jgi:putative protease
MFVVIPNNINELPLYQEKGINTFIIGLEDYCINYPSVSLEDIKKLSSKYSLFISVNKNIFNSELADLKEKLIELSELTIEGVLFYDLGILNLVKENNIKLNLVWHQTHMVTNYNTCNYYYDKKVNYGFLANEITLEEILEIKKKTKMKLMVEVFGYPIMSHSRRMLLTNYFKAVKEEKENRLYHLKENENEYLLKENNHGASILYGKLINGTKPLFDLIKNKMDYLVLDMQEVDFNLGLKVLDTYLYIYNHFSDIKEVEKESLISNMNNLIGDSTNFFYKKTIYKVKKGDKS